MKLNLAESNNSFNSPQFNHKPMINTMIPRTIFTVTIILCSIATAWAQQDNQTAEGVEVATKYNGIFYYVAQNDTSAEDNSEYADYVTEESDPFMEEETVETDSSMEDDASDYDDSSYDDVESDYDDMESDMDYEESSGDEYEPIEELEAPLSELDDIEVEVLPESDVSLDYGEESVSETLATRESETISVDFPDEEIRTIIRNVADLYDLNVVIPETLVGNTSVRLRNVTWRQVFKVVLEPIQYTYIEDDNIIKIKSNEEIIAEPVDTRVFIINYAKAGDLQGAIAPLIDSATGGRIQVDSRSNSLVITERPSRMNRVQEIIERLDRPTDQVMIESKFIEITDRNAKDIGISWASLRNYTLQAGPVERIYEDDNYELDDDSVVGEDRTIDQVDTTNNSQSSSTSSGGGYSADSGIITTSNILNDVSYQIDDLNKVIQGRQDTALFSASAFQVVLKALNANTDVELISNPTVVTMNNTPASINIGEEFPIPDYTYNDERGTFEVAGFEYKAIGIILNVTPHVNSMGFINLNITPEISSRAGTVKFGGASEAEIPIVATRKTSSVVTIKDGFTLAIGGLMEKSVTEDVDKVPFMGDIPGLGRFFRSKSKSEETRNLIIFITAKTLNPDGSTYKDIFSPRMLHEMGIKETDIPGQPIPEEELQMYQEANEARSAIESKKKQEKLRQQIEILNKLDSGELDEKKLTKKQKKLLW